MTYVLEAGPIRIGFLFHNPRFEELFVDRYSGHLTKQKAEIHITVDEKDTLEPGYSADVEISAGLKTMHAFSKAMEFLYSQETKCGTLAVSSRIERGVDSIENALRVITQIFALCHNCLIIHSCAVGNEEKCILLPGGEGEGKTTIASLCMELGCAVYGDDLVMASPGPDDSVSIYSLPFRGETDISFRKKPGILQEILFIKKGKGTTVRSLKKAEAAGMLFSNVPFIGKSQKHVIEAVFSIVNEIVKKPASLFSYDLASSPQQVIGERLFG